MMHTAEVFVLCFNHSGDISGVVVVHNNVIVKHKVLLLLIILLLLLCLYCRMLRSTVQLEESMEKIARDQVVINVEANELKCSSQSTTKHVIILFALLREGIKCDHVENGLEAQARKTSKVVEDEAINKMSN